MAKRYTAGNVDRGGAVRGLFWSGVARFCRDRCAGLMSARNWTSPSDRGVL